MSRLSYRLQKLEESIASNGKEVGLGEILHWLYRMYGPRLELDEPLPLTSDEQREYEDYQRRGETSKFVLMLAELYAARGEADQVAQAHFCRSPYRVRISSRTGDRLWGGAFARGCCDRIPRDQAR